MINTLTKKRNRNRNSQLTLYTKAYRLLEHVTPLRSDCGLLCNKACCDGGDEDLGMYLFPGEIKLLAKSSYFRIEATDIILGNGIPVLLANCDGNCNRSVRPLACRIFPLTPYLSSNGTLSVKLDVRALGVCPLVNAGKNPPLRPDFIETVRQVTGMLAKDPEILDFIAKLSRILDEYCFV